MVVQCFSYLFIEIIIHVGRNGNAEKIAIPFNEHDSVIFLLCSACNQFCLPAKIFGFSWNAKNWPRPTIINCRCDQIPAHSNGENLKFGFLSVCVSECYLQMHFVSSSHVQFIESKGISRYF